ncbi:flavohemoglobin expression-modulating QEGLA motif protein [Sphingomonas cavernae]|nr:flavohemoglobin expression-modulating QEGLA motif protein [Sphingomonas cavernae]
MAASALPLRMTSDISKNTDADAFRVPLANGGTAHIDRPLPFLMLCRVNGRDPNSLAGLVASLSPAYVLWSGESDAEALAIIAAISARQRKRDAPLLLVSLYDLPRDPVLDEAAPRLERFTCRLSASEDPAAQAASECLTEALTAITADLRTCAVEHVSKAWFEPGVEPMVDNASHISHLSLGLPQNYRVPGKTAVYPQLLHDLSVSVFDALLQAFRIFIARSGKDAPKSHRSLGRSTFVTAARSIDRKLLRVATSYDFLLGISPVNTVEAFEQFKASRFEASPVFRYRPLPVDPDLAKRALYAIDLRRAEDPVLETLFAEKRHELDQQLTMLHHRNTPTFRYASLMLYGPVEPELLAAAQEILDRPVTDRDEKPEMVDAATIRETARSLIRRYRESDPRFIARTSIRDDLAPGLMVTGRNLLISSATRMRRARLDALLQHEVSVHLLTCVNGDAQGLKIFRTGLAGYEGIQEGLGVFAEAVSNGLTRARLRLLAARVVVVHAMLGGAGFVDCFRLLAEENGIKQAPAFNIVARVFRSGGLTKDAIYLRGFKEVLGLLASGQNLAPFWVGKIAARHIPVVEELALRGVLKSPRTIPEFLSRDGATERIDQLRNLSSVAHLI